MVGGPDIKQVLVIRTDLKMGIGKTAAQASHASVLATLNAKSHETNWFNSWKRSGMKKIVVKVQSEEELNQTYHLASKANLPRAIINDAGHTQLAPGTSTAVGIGPAPANFIDPITGNLKLL